MSFEDLKKISLEEYIISNSKLKSLLIFMHIPKTAGSSFSEALQKFLPPYKNIEVDYKDNTRTHNEKLEHSVSKFIGETSIKNYASASGHMPYDLIEKIAHELPDQRLVTFLRNPIKRVVSDYRYQRTPQHPPYVKFIEDFPTIQDFILDRNSSNKLTKFICGRYREASAENAINILNKKFMFVGLVEMYPFSYNTILSLAGVAGKFPNSHLRKTPDTAETEVFLNENINNLIKENNIEDLKVFNYVKDILTPLKDNWVKVRGLTSG